MAFHDVRLPEDIETGAQGGPGFKTSVVSLSGGAEQRVITWEQQRAQWDVGYGIQEPEDFEPVEAFFYGRRGMGHTFRFRDWHDYQCDHERIGTGNGTLRTFLFIKTYEPAGPAPYVRRITRPVEATIEIYVNGLLADPGTYDAFAAGGWVRFHSGSAPAGGQAVELVCDFDIPCRFDVDDLKLTLFWLKAGQIPHLPIIEDRDVINQAPQVSLVNKVSTLPENTSTASRVRVADVVVDDDPFGEDRLTLSSADAVFFELVGTLTSDGTGVSLYLKAGTVLNATNKPSYVVTVNVIDDAISGAVQDFDSHTVTITAVEGPPDVSLTNLHASLAWDEDTTSRIRVADVVVAQRAPSATNNVLSLTGANAASFELGTTTGLNFTTQLYIKAGTAHAPDAMTPVSYNVTVNVANADFSSPPQDTASLTVTFGVAGSITTDTTPGDHVYVVPEYQTLVIEGWGGGAGAPGTNNPGSSGAATTLTAKSLTAGGGQTPALTTTAGTTGTAMYNTLGGAGGTASGGDVNTVGNRGGNGQAKLEVPSGSTVTSGAGGSAPSGGAGGAAVSATTPTQPFTGSPCSPAPPVPYPVPGSVAGTNGNAGVSPGGGGAGAATAGWEVVLSLAAGYCWKLYAAGRPGGGSGGRFSKTYVRGVTPGAPVPGDSLSYHVGAAGIGGDDIGDGGAGAPGRMKFTVT